VIVEINEKIRSQELNCYEGEGVVKGSVLEQ